MSLTRLVSTCIVLATICFADTANGEERKPHGRFLHTYPSKDPISKDDENSLRRVWVHFKDGQRNSGVQTIQKIASTTGDDSTVKLQVNYDFPKVNSMVITASDDEIKHLLMNDPNIKKITDDPIRRQHRLQSHDCRRERHERKLLNWNGQASSYGIDLVEAKKVWDQGITGNNITVCVIDSGIDADHEDFEQTIITGENLTLYENWSDDENGHGTHVSGIIAANNNDKGLVGIAYDANIHMIPVFDDFGFVYSSALIDAAYKCRDAGAKIISMSLGGDFSLDEEREAFTELFVQDGILSIASSGNYGDSSHSYPASYADVISVGAIDRNKDRASFSQYNDMVDLVAPGFGVWSTIPMNFDCSICAEKVASGYVSLDGTSMAAPHVAALAALLWSYDPSAPVEHIHNALLASAEDLGTLGRDNYYGYGLPRAGFALSTLNETLNGAPLQDWGMETISNPSGIDDDEDVLSCTSHEILVEVEVKTDHYGNETSWEVVRDVDGFIVMAGVDLENRKLYKNNRCIPRNCYTFSIYDSFGDGINGGFGKGYYNVSVNGTEIASGGNFTSSESAALGLECVALSTDPKPPLPDCVEVSLRLVTDTFPSETTVALVNTNGTDSYWSDEIFTLSYTEYTLDACVNRDSCYRFEIFDDWGDGIIGYTFEPLVELSYDGSIVYTSDGSFSCSDSYLVGDSCLDQI